MKDCRFFEQRLLSCFPYQNRNGIESTLQSVNASQVMLDVFQSAVNYSLRQTNLSAEEIAIIAFGSYGRLDGHTAVSDFDFAIIYSGKEDSQRIENLRGLVKKIVLSNQCLLFDHRDKIESDDFDFSRSPAYPILSTSELTSDALSIRALQILTEGRIVQDGGIGAKCRIELLSSWGFSQDATRLDLSKLKTELNKFKESYCEGVMCRRVDDRWKLTNRKVLKVLALREFSYIATLFAVVEITLAVAAGDCEELDAIRVLSSPSILKIASFLSSRGALAHHLERIGLPVKTEICRVLRSHIDIAQSEKKANFNDLNSEPREGEILSLLKPVQIKLGYNQPLGMRHRAQSI